MAQSVQECSKCRIELGANNRITVASAIGHYGVVGETMPDNNCPGGGTHDIHRIQDGYKTPLMFSLNGLLPGDIALYPNVSQIIFEFMYKNNPKDLYNYIQRDDINHDDINFLFFRCVLDDTPSIIMEQYANLTDEYEFKQLNEEQRMTILCLIKSKPRSPFASKIARIAAECKCRGYIRLVEVKQTFAIFAIVAQAESICNLSLFYQALCDRFEEFNDIKIKRFAIEFGRLFHDFMTLSVLPSISCNETTPHLSIFNSKSNCAFLGHRNLYRYPITFEQMSDDRSRLSYTERLHIDNSYHGKYERVLDPPKRKDIEIRLNEKYLKMFDGSEDGTI